MHAGNRTINWISIKPMGTMDGKICLVTGGTSGIGFYTAQEIARMGASVILIGRDEARCENAIHQIRTESHNQSVDYLLADLSSQAQIRRIAKEFYERYDHLDVLVNNAGGAFLSRQLTVDGIEMTFALNHLAYFLLTLLLLEGLQSSPSARVINVSSGSHYGKHLNFDDLQFKHFYNPVAAYGRSKLANILFTYELSRRFADSRFTANALTPGMVATDIWKKLNRWLTPFIYPVIMRLGQTPLEGAQTSIYLATSPQVEGVSGKYFADKHPINSSPESYELTTAERLWQASLDMVGMGKINM